MKLLILLLALCSTAVCEDSLYLKSDKIEFLSGFTDVTGVSIAKPDGKAHIFVNGLDIQKTLEAVSEFLEIPDEHLNEAKITNGLGRSEPTTEQKLRDQADRIERQKKAVAEFRRLLEALRKIEK